MSLSLLCALSLGSSVSGVARRTCVVNSVMPSVDGRRHRLLVLGDDHDRRGPHRHPRVLVRRRLHAAGDHQPHVHAVDHVVGPQRRVDRGGELARGSGRRPAGSPAPPRRAGRGAARGTPGGRRAPAAPPRPRRRARSRSRTPRPRPGRGGAGRPLTQTRISALRGSSTWSWVPCAMRATLDAGSHQVSHANIRTGHCGGIKGSASRRGLPDPAAGLVRRQGAGQDGNRQPPPGPAAGFPRRRSGHHDAGLGAHRASDDRDAGAAGPGAGSGRGAGPRRLGGRVRVGRALLQARPDRLHGRGGPAGARPRGRRHHRRRR